MDNYLPNLLFLELKNSENQRIYEIELDKDKKATVSLNAVISFSDKMLKDYKEFNYLDTAYVFLTVETTLELYITSLFNAILVFF